MRLTRRHKIWLTVAALFILMNVFLIYFDKEQNVAKTSHIKTWTKTAEEDMYESILTEGVLDYSTANHIFFDSQLGEFQSFLVEEGQEVQAGDGLYTYQISNYYETAASLQHEIDKLNGDITAIQTAISTMQSYQIPSVNPSPSPSIGESEVAEEGTEGSNTAAIQALAEALSGAQDSGQAELIKEQYITEKEKELAQKNAEQQSLEAQLAELTQTGDTMTVESPYNGVVSNLSDSLEDPLLTIQSDDLIIKGELNEREHLEVGSGNPVSIVLKESGKTVEGQIESVSQTPEKITIKGESLYPFKASLTDDRNDDIESTENMDGHIDENENMNDEMDENQNEQSSEKMTQDNEEEQFAAGYHADVEIITEESQEATVLKKQVLDGRSVWKMMKNGRLGKEEVVLGLQMDKTVEIKEGAETGDWIAAKPKNRFVPGSPFITSLQLDKLNKSSLKTDRWFRDIMIGLISR